MVFTTTVLLHSGICLFAPMGINLSCHIKWSVSKKIEFPFWKNNFLISFFLFLELNFICSSIIFVFSIFLLFHFNFDIHFIIFGHIFHFYSSIYFFLTFISFFNIYKVFHFFSKMALGRWHWNLDAWEINVWSFYCTIIFLWHLQLIVDYHLCVTYVNWNIQRNNIWGDYIWVSIFE